MASAKSNLAMQELGMTKLPFTLTDEIHLNYEKDLEKYQVQNLTDALYDVILEAFPTGDIEKIEGNVLLNIDELTFLGRVTTTKRVRKGLK